jgi:hypothetical protein
VSDIADLILKKIMLLEETRELLGHAAKVKATTSAEYDKQLAIVLVKLSNGVELEVGGERIQKPPASTSEKIAKGIVSDFKFAMDVAESEYKSMITKLECIKQELCGYQSINRYLDTTV